MGFPRQEYWSGLPCPPLGDLPDPGIEPGSPALQTYSLPTEPRGKMSQAPSNPGSPDVSYSGGSAVLPTLGIGPPHTPAPHALPSFSTPGPGCIMLSTRATCAVRQSWLCSMCLAQLSGLTMTLKKRGRCLFCSLVYTHKLHSDSEVAQLCLTLCDSMDCRLPGSSGDSPGSFSGKSTGVGCHFLLQNWLTILKM